MAFLSPSVLPEKFKDNTINMVAIAIFHTLPNSLFAIQKY
jgi:hypothetical protein